MVDELIDGTILYHGSYCEVKKIDLKQCRRYRDFGQGFYLTTNRQQAENFALISTRKAIANRLTDPFQNFGIVSSFRFQHDLPLKIKIFPDADADWLHCVIGHRRPEYFSDEIIKLNNFDIIGGKIADDNTNATILAYMAGTFGTAGSIQADNLCIGLLLPERLKDQYCFRTNKALECLTSEGCDRIWMNK